MCFLLRSNGVRCFVGLSPDPPKIGGSFYLPTVIGDLEETWASAGPSCLPDQTKSEKESRLLFVQLLIAFIKAHALHRNGASIEFGWLAGWLSAQTRRSV